MYPRYREKQIPKQCFSLFVALELIERRHDMTYELITALILTQAVTAIVVGLAVSWALLVVLKVVVNIMKGDHDWKH